MISDFEKNFVFFDIRPILPYYRKLSQLVKEVVMSFDSFEGIIHFAIGKEEEAVAFYEDASRREAYSGARKVFSDFADEERKHVALLSGYLKGEKKIEDYRFAWVPDLKRSNYMVDLNYEEGMAYPDLLRLAMKREESSLRLYNDLQKKAEDEETEKIFKMLSQEEAKHKLALETLYDDYMAGQGD
jgi:rubrerythrin